VAPRVHETAPVMAADTMLSEPSVSLLGIDDATRTGFDRLVDAEGQTLSVAGLGSGEVYVSDELAESLGVGPGDQVVTFLGPMPTPLTVAGVYADGAYPGGNLSLIMPLAELQAATGNAGQLNRIVISNHGDTVQCRGHRRRPRGAAAGARRDRAAGRPGQAGRTRRG
jgi:ABC-type lipoprotein release transport system permease subunit